MTENDERLPETIADDAAGRLERIERKLSNLVPDAATGATQLGERLVVLEGQVNYHARMGRLTAIMLCAILATVLSVGGVVIWHLGQRMEALVAERLTMLRVLASMCDGLASDREQTLGAFKAMSEMVTADRAETAKLLGKLADAKQGGGATGIGTLSPSDIANMRGIVSQVLGGDGSGNGLLESLGLQEELLDELQGRPRRRARR